MLKLVRILLSELLQQKNMYKGKKLEESSIIHKSFSSSLLCESTNQVFEREIDNYTRLLEQDKRKFFRVQEHHNEVVKEYSKKVKELDMLKGRQFKNQMFKMKGKVKILEGELDQTINSYNHIIASNKKLKNEIDQLRKAKLAQKQVIKKITTRIQQYSDLLAQEQDQIERKRLAIGQTRQEIISIKMHNQSQAKLFRDQVSNVQTNLASSKSGSQILKRKSEIEQKTEGVDTQPLVRYRLRHLIMRNKQRVKIIQSYRKTMEAIWKSFEEIKEQSGINDLQEITSTFLKHEHQNQFIYEYIDKLNRDIEDINDSIESLQQKIEDQKETNENYVKQLGDTPKKELIKQAHQRFEDKCQKDIAKLEVFLTAAEPELKELGGCDELTKFNLIEELAKLQSSIDYHFPAGQESSSNFFREQALRYTKGPPGYAEELKENREEKLLDAQKLREFAVDFWQKRKNKPEAK